MDISVMSALVIATRGNDVKCRCTKMGPKKWAGEIALFKGDDYDHAILTSDPIYDSKSSCLEAMENIVKDIREVYARGEIGNPFDKLFKSHKKITRKIVEEVCDSRNGERIDKLHIALKPMRAAEFIALNLVVMHTDC